MFNNLVNGLFYTIIPSVLFYRTLKINLQRRYTSPQSSMKTLSTLHATLSSGLSIAYLSDLVALNNYSLGISLISSGFFLVDLAHIMLYQRHYSKHLLMSYYLHHIFALVGLSYVNVFPYYVARGYLSELSTPFLNISWSLSKRGQKGLLYFINSVAVISMFLSARIYNISNLIYHRPENAGVAFHLITSLFLGLNLSWFQGLLVLYYKDYQNYKHKLA